MLKPEPSPSINRISKVSFGGMDNQADLENNSPRQTASFNEVISNRSSIGSVLNMSAVHHLAPVNDFKRGIENEKNLNQFILHYDHLLNQPRGNKSTESAISILERTYKMQIDALLEEVHKLKLNQKILEKRLEDSDSGTRARSKSPHSSSSCSSSHCKMTLNAKDSIIAELEFQIQQSNSELSYLRSANEIQRAEMERMNQDISSFGKLRAQLEEYQDEIALLKQKLQMEETKHNRVNQELQHSRSQSRSFIQHSIQRTSRPLSEKESIILTPNPKSNKSATDLQAVTRKLSALEMTQNSSMMGSPTIKNQSQSYLRQEFQDANSTNMSFTRALNAPGTSLKTLNNYERTLHRELEINPKSVDKINSRLVELKKIKGFYLQEENKKMMSAINKRDNSSERSLIKERILIDLDAELGKMPPKQSL